MPLNVGPMELIIVLAIALIVLGPKRLPDAGRALGSGIRNFRRSLTLEPSDEAPDERPTINPAQADLRRAARPRSGSA
jgi:sec-independent protein translocase protein TatA